MANICSYCEEDQATLSCNECSQIFCQDCFGTLHSKGKWRNHTSEPYVDPQEKLREEIEQKKTEIQQQEEPSFEELLKMALPDESTYQEFMPNLDEDVLSNPDDTQPEDSSGSSAQQLKIDNQTHSEEPILPTSQDTIQNDAPSRTTLPSEATPASPSLNRSSSPIGSSPVQASRPHEKMELKVGLKLKGKPMTMMMKPAMKPAIGKPNTTSAQKPVSQMAQMLKIPSANPTLKPQIKPTGGFKPAQTQPQQKPAAPKLFISPDRISITISEPQKKLKREFLFSKYAPIREVLAWASVRLLGIPYPTSFIDDVPYYNLKHEGIWLDQARSLFTYGITNSSELILEERKKESKTISVRTNCAAAPVIQVKAHEGSGLWLLTQQVLKVLYKQGWVSSDKEWSLFQNGKSPVRESSLVCELSGPELSDLQLRPVSPKAEVVLDVVYNRSYTMSFNPEMTVGEAVVAFIKAIGLKESIGLFVVDSFCFVQIREDPGISLTDSIDTNISFFEEEIWLDNHQKLSQIPNLTLVELRKRVLTYCICFEDNSTQYLSFDHHAIVKDCLDMILQNAESPKNPEQYALYTGVDELRPERTLQSYSIKENKIQFQKKLDGLLVLNDEHGQVHLKVDYSKAIKEHLQTIWNEFGVFEGAEPRTPWSLRRLSPDTGLDLEKSLAAQGIEKGGTIILKTEPKEQMKAAEPTFLDIANETNIWQEPNEPSTAAYDAENNNRIKAGTLNKLVEYLTETSDFEYQGSFLLSYRSFTTPDMLFKKLTERYNCPKDFPNTRVIQLRVLNILKHWMEKSYGDLSHDLTEKITAFIDSLPPEHAPFVSAMRRSILQRTCGLKTISNSNFLFRGNHPEPILKISSRAKGPPEIWDYDDLEIARQLTLIEFRNFERIQPFELLNQRWSKHPTETPSVVKSSKTSTQISLWVASSIMEQTRAKLRAKRWCKIIKIAQHLRNLNNFSTMMAFIGGWNNAAVSRLKFTKDLLPKSLVQAMTSMESEMSPQHSSKAYRSALASSAPPVVPYLGIHLSDLTFIDEGNNDLLNGLINVNKRILCYRVISELQRYQNSKYKLKEVKDIAKYFENIPDITEKEFSDKAFKQSLLLEPRNATKVV